MQTLIIETNQETDFQLLVNLAKRLKLNFREEKSTKKRKNIKNEELFFSLAGCINEIEANEMIEQIENARTTKDIDISWVK